MKAIIERRYEGRWEALHVFEAGRDMMDKARASFNAMLHEGRPLRLIVVHAEHDGTSASARLLLK